MGTASAALEPSGARPADSASAQRPPGGVPGPPPAGPLRCSRPGLAAPSGLGENARKATAGPLPAGAQRGRARALLSLAVPKPGLAARVTAAATEPPGPWPSAPKPARVLSQLFSTRSSSEVIIIPNGPGPLPSPRDEKRFSSHNVLLCKAECAFKAKVLCMIWKYLGIY